MAVVMARQVRETGHGDGHFLYHGGQKTPGEELPTPQEEGESSRATERGVAFVAVAPAWPAQRRRRRRRAVTGWNITREADYFRQLDM